MERGWEPSGLSILDLAQGQQPMCTPDGELWIVFNGEIFSYIELRAEVVALGYRYRTSSDTEVLLLFTGITGAVP